MRRPSSSSWASSAPGPNREMPLWLVSNDLFQLLYERREVCLDNLPQDIEIDLIVAVSQAVARCDDSRPRDVRVSLLCLLGNAVCCFADNLNQFLHGELKNPVIREVLQTSLAGQVDGFPGVDEHIDQAYPVITPAHTESPPS